MVKGWQKNCIILQKSTHSKAYFVSPSILYAHFGKENINGMQKERSLSASLPICLCAYAHKSILSIVLLLMRSIVSCVIVASSIYDSRFSIFWHL